MKMLHQSCDMSQQMYLVCDCAVADYVVQANTDFSTKLRQALISPDCPLDPRYNGHVQTSLQR